MDSHRPVNIASDRLSPILRPLGSMADSQGTLPIPINQFEPEDGSQHEENPSAACPDVEPARGVLTRSSTGPAYSVFSPGMRKWIITVVTFTSFISPMTANIYFPALNSIAQALAVKLSLVNFTLTTYMICQGLAPPIFGDFGDMAGRRPAFIIAISIYLVANLGLVFQHSYAALMVLRMVQSIGSSGTFALTYAVVADVTTSAERGKYMGIAGAGVNVGTTLSPVIGGILAQELGWRSIFWFCFIYTAAILVPYALTVPETCRTIVGNGSIPAQGWNMTLLDVLQRSWRKRRAQRNSSDPDSDPEPDQLSPDNLAPRTKLRLPNPLRALSVACDKGVGLIILYNSLLYIVFIISAATLSTQFKRIYGFNDIQIGLCYLPYGGGCLVAAIGQGYLLDWNYRRVARRIGVAVDRRRGDDLSRFPIEAARIVPMYYFVTVGLTAMILYGWLLERNVSVAAMLCLLFVIGLCITGSFGILNTLIVDICPDAPASAVAANNFVRCEMGAAMTAAVEPMILAMGTGWCFTFLALLPAVSFPILWAEARHGVEWRETKRLKRETREAREAEKKRNAEKERKVEKKRKAEKDGKAKKMRKAEKEGKAEKKRTDQGHNL